MGWVLATWEVEWEVCTIFSSGVISLLLWPPLKHSFPLLGMDNFGGMNNMDRFGSSGMGRMNGKDSGVKDSKAGVEHFHVLLDVSNGFISCIGRDGPWDWWCF